MAAGKLYGPFFQSVCNKEIDLDSDTIKVMLCTSAYTPDQDAHRYKSSVTSEVTGAGYTAGGATLTSVTAAYNAATNTFTFDAGDTSWPTSTITARYAVIYDATPASDATRPLICYVDFATDQVSAGAAFTIAWDPAGIVSLTAA